MSQDAFAAGVSDWLGRFRDPQLEARYRLHVQGERAQQTIRAVLVAAVMFAAFGLSDYALLGSGDPALTPLLALRAAVVAACLVLVAALRRQPALVDAVWPVNMLLSVGIAAIILIVPLRPSTIDTQASAVIVATFAVYLFVPNRIPWMIAQNALLSGGFLMAVRLLADAPARVMVTYVLLMALVNTVGLMSAQRLMRLRRENFATLCEEREVNDRLQSEIAARQHLERKLTQLVRTDELTGLNNRRRVAELADQLMRMARREGTPVAVCMIDLDHFKAINDDFGHSAGDRVLVAAAGCLREALRESDVLGRFGGEEFIAVLPQTDLQEAMDTAERLRQAVTGLSQQELRLPVGISATVGVAEVHQGEHTIDAAVTRADDALLRGKREGRDRVVSAALDPAV